MQSSQLEVVVTVTSVGLDMPDSATPKLAATSSTTPPRQAGEAWHANAHWLSHLNTKPFVLPCYVHALFMGSNGKRNEQCSSFFLAMRVLDKSMHVCV